MSRTVAWIAAVVVLALVGAGVATRHWALTQREDDQEAWRAVLADTAWIDLDRASIDEHAPCADDSDERGVREGYVTLSASQGTAWLASYSDRLRAAGWTPGTPGTPQAPLLAEATRSIRGRSSTATVRKSPAIQHRYDLVVTVDLTPRFCH